MVTKKQKTKQKHGGSKDTKFNKLGVVIPLWLCSSFIYSVYGKGGDLPFEDQAQCAALAAAQRTESSPL